MGFPVLSNPLRVFNTLQMAQLAAGLKNQSTSELASCHTALPEPADKASYSEYESQFLAFCTGLPIYPWRCTANPHVNTMAAMFFSHSGTPTAYQGVTKAVKLKPVRNILTGNKDPRMSGNLAILNLFCTVLA